MSRSRVHVFVVVLAMTLTSLVTIGPVAAAESPLAAADALVDKIQRGDFDGLDEVVCAAEQDSVRNLFDVGSQLTDIPGVDTSSFAGAFSISLEDVSTELLSEDGDTANVRLQGRMTIMIDAGLAREFVRSMASAFGDEELSDEELDELTPIMLSSFTEPQDIDEDLAVVREDGEWRICDDLGGTTGGGDELPGSTGFGTQVSFEGLCGLVTIEQVNALGELTYDSSFGEPDYCSYSATDSDGYSLTALVDRSSSLEDFAIFYGEAEATTVAGQPAFVIEDAIYVGLPDGGTFQATTFLDPGNPVEVDIAAQLLAFAELLVPHIPQGGEIEPIEPIEPIADAPVSIFVGQIPLCDAMSLDQLNALSPLQYDDMSGEGADCTYSTATFENGFYLVTLGLIDDLSIEEFREFIPDGSDVTVGGLPGYFLNDSLWLETDAGLLSIGAYFDEGAAGEDISSLSYATQISDIVLAALPGLQALESGDPTGLPVEELAPDIESFETPISEDSLCLLIELDAINTLGPLQYDDIFDAGSELCVYSSSVSEEGSHTLSIYRELFSLEDLRTIFEDGVDSTVGGLPAFGDATTLWLDTADGVIAISPLFDDAPAAQGIDHLEFAAQIGELLAAATTGDE